MNKIITDKGTQIWRNKKYQHHRTDGPAIIRCNGTQIWYINGKKHRVDGPAYIRKDRNLWYVNSERIYDNKSFQSAANITDEDMLAMILKYGNVS
jgi:hypothetical protein